MGRAGPALSPQTGWRGLLAFCLGLGLVLATAAGTLEPLVSPEQRLLHAVNEVRARHQLRPLLPHQALGRVAHAHAQDMARNGYLDHVNARGQSPLDRVQAAGIAGFRLLAENLGASSESRGRVRRILEAWLASPDHRENLLNPAFNRSGSAVLEAGRRLIAVQLYATFPPPAGEGDRAEPSPGATEPAAP